MKRARPISGFIRQPLVPKPGLRVIGHRFGLSAALAAFVLFLSASAYAQELQDEVVYLDTDGIGSVRLVTDASGNVLERHDYQPFGQETPQASGSNPLFAGKERDASGIDYSGARYFVAKLGRFTAVDPKLNSEKASTDPQHWNRYAYVRNSPLLFVDPNGLEGVLGGDGMQSVKCLARDFQEECIVEAPTSPWDDINDSDAWGGVHDFTGRPGGPPLNFFDEPQRGSSSGGSGQSTAINQQDSNAQTGQNTQTGQGANTGSVSSGSQSSGAVPRIKADVPLLGTPGTEFNCRTYRDGSSAGSELMLLCQYFPFGETRWGRCVRTGLLANYDPAEMTRYLLYWHPKLFYECFPSGMTK